MLRHPPHILVTTPESLYILLTSAKPRENLRRVRTVIVDEIHAVAGNKRGTHLSLSLERLEALVCGENPLVAGRVSDGLRTRAAADRAFGDAESDFAGGGVSDRLACAAACCGDCAGRAATDA